MPAGSCGHTLPEPPSGHWVARIVHGLRPSTPNGPVEQIYRQIAHHSPRPGQTATVEVDLFTRLRVAIVDDQSVSEFAGAALRPPATAG